MTSGRSNALVGVIIGLVGTTELGHAQGADLAELHAGLDEAEAELRNGNHDSARRRVADALRRALEIAEPSTRELEALLWRIAGIANGCGDPEEAHRALTRMLDLVAIRFAEDSDPVLSVRARLAQVKAELGDLEGAIALHQSVLDVRTRQLPEDHPALQDARANLAYARRRAGDLDGALQLQRMVLQVRSRTLPDDDPYVQYARGELASTLLDNGDYREALVLFEKVYDVLRATRPEDDPDLERVIMDVARTRYRLGDFRGARDLQEAQLARLESRVPDDHPLLQAARSNLAATLADLGDLVGACRLEQTVLDVSSLRLPDDHPDLQAVRSNLASSKLALGDLSGALVLQEKVVEVLSRTLPSDHLERQTAELNLAEVLREHGEPRAALRLQEPVLRAFEIRFPADHPDLQRARQNVAATLAALGHLDRQTRLLGAVLDVYTRTLDADDPRLQTALLNLAVCKFEAGDMAAALALQRAAVDGMERAQSSSGPEVLRGRRMQAVLMERLGESAAARSLLRAALADWDENLPSDHPEVSLAKQTLASMEARQGDLGQRLTVLQKVVDELKWLPTQDLGRLGAELNLSVARRNHGDLEEAERLQDAVAKRLSKMVSPGHPQLCRARHQLGRTRTMLGQSDRVRQLAVEQAADVRLRLARSSESPRQVAWQAREYRYVLSDLCSLAVGCGWLDPMPDLGGATLVLAESMRANEVRVARRARQASVAPSRVTEIDRELAAVSYELSRIDRERVAGEEEAQLARLREREQRRAQAVLRKDRLWRELREIVGDDPEGDTRFQTTISALAAALPAGSAMASIVSYSHFERNPDGKLQEGRGERRMLGLCLGRAGDVTVVPLGSCDVVEKLVARVRWEAGVRTAGPTPPVARPSAREALRRAVLDPILAALPAVETLFLSVDDVLQLVPMDALTDASGDLVLDNLLIRLQVSLLELTQVRGAARGEHRLVLFGDIDYGEPSEAARARSSQFSPLPHSRREIEAVGALFEQAFDRPASIVTGVHASLDHLVEQCREISHLHLATHGYFAPESVPTLGENGATPDWWLDGFTGASGLSPMVLCGLALARANTMSDGTRLGVVTAENLCALDLSSCDLVVLSACNTSVGVRRAGQGYASLREALQASGARFVLSSLWQVGDEATRDLMEDFYRNMWQNGLDPHNALRAARLSARGRGAKYRDWAGWVLSGH